MVWEIGVSVSGVRLGLVKPWLRIFFLSLILVVFMKK